MPLALTVTMLVLLGFAAWRDVATRTIPDFISISLALLGATLRICAGWQAIALSLIAAVAIFLPLLACHARGLIGGADVKLLTALALGLSPTASYQLVVATALVGGLLAALYAALARLLTGVAVRTISCRNRRVPSRVARVELRRVQRQEPLPYAVAIAIGAAIVLTEHVGI